MGVMRRYKQTDVGVIPEDWEVKQIGELKPFITSGSRGWAAFYSDRGAPFIRITNLSRGSIYLHLEELRLVNLPKDASEGIRTQLQDQDILISITADIGIIGYVSSEVPKPAYINQHIALVRFDSSKVDPKFVSYSLASEKPQKLLRALTDSGAKAGISLVTVQKIHLALPPTKAEQEAIAEALSDADALIRSLEQLISKKRNIKQGAMQNLFHPKDGWALKNLGDICSVSKERFDPLSSSAEQRCIELEHVSQETGRLLGHLVTTDLRSQKAVFKRGDILFGKLRPYLRKFWHATFGGVCSTEFWVIKADEGIRSEWLYWLVQSDLVVSAANKSTGTKMPRGEWKTVSETEIYVPRTEAEQTSIATILSDMDTEIDALESKLSKCRQLKQGMMHNLLTGKIRLVAPGIAKAKQRASLKKENVVTPRRVEAHNWAFNEAVIISVLADQFGKPDFPLGRKRRTKLSYLFHRKTDQEVQGYLRKAAGPYNPRAKYAGPEKIAQENGYVRDHQSGKFNGFIAAEKIEQAKTYFAKWYDPTITSWLEQFRFKSNDDLECLTTVDMAMQGLLKEDKTADVESVRALIASEPEWLPKLKRSVFSDSGIAAAIAESHALFGP